MRKNSIFSFLNLATNPAEKKKKLYVNKTLKINFVSDKSYVTSYECKETHKVGWMKRYNYASKEEKKAG